MTWWMKGRNLRQEKEHEPKPLFPQQKIPNEAERKKEIGHMPKPLFGRTNDDGSSKAEPAQSSGPKKLSFGDSSNSSPAPAPVIANNSNSSSPKKLQLEEPKKSTVEPVKPIDFKRFSTPASPKRNVSNLGSMLHQMEKEAEQAAESVKKHAQSVPKAMFGEASISTDDVTAGDILKWRQFDEIGIAKLKILAKNLDLSDRKKNLLFANDVSQRMLNAVNGMLDVARKTSTAEVDENLKKILILIRSDEEQPEQKKDNGLIGNAFASLSKTLFGAPDDKPLSKQERFKAMISAVDILSDEIMEQHDMFAHFVEMLDEMLRTSKNLHTDLLIHVEAGKLRIEEFRSGRMKKLEDQLTMANRPMIVQEARDEIDIFNTFVKRIQTLDTMVMQNELTLEQIRLQITGNSQCLNNLSIMLSSTLPMWKQSIVSALSTGNYSSVQSNKDVLEEAIGDIISK